MKTEKPEGTKRVMKSVPAYGDKASADVKNLKDALRERGFDPGTGPDFDTATLTALQNFQKSKGLKGTGVIPADGGDTFAFLGLTLEKEDKPTVPVPASRTPWLTRARTYIGMGEKVAKFVAWLSPFWKIVGLNYKTIIGSSFAWCGLFIAVMMSETGQEWIRNGAGAKNWDKYGQAIEYKVNGIPAGAVVRINHKGDCSAGSNNHVTFAEGSCKKDDIIEMVKDSKGVWVPKVKAGATFPGLGGNQGDQVKISWYPVSHICAVRWPPKQALPAPVAASDGCNGKASTGESTR